MVLYFVPLIDATFYRVMASVNSQWSKKRPRRPVNSPWSKKRPRWPASAGPAPNAFCNIGNGTTPKKQRESNPNQKCKSEQREKEKDSNLSIITE